MCNDCLQQIKSNLSTEALQVLEVLPASKNEAMHKSGLSYSLTNRAFIELEACMLIRYAEKGRSKEYTLTKDGSTIKNGPSEPISWKPF